LVICGRQERCIQGFGADSWEEEALGRPMQGHEIIILKWAFKKWDWIISTDLAVDNNMCRTLVNAVLNIQCP